MQPVENLVTLPSRSFIQDDLLSNLEWLRRRAKIELIFSERLITMSLSKTTQSSDTI